MSNLLYFTVISLIQTQIQINITILLIVSQLNYNSYRLFITYVHHW